MLTTSIYPSKRIIEHCLAHDRDTGRRFKHRPAEATRFDLVRKDDSIILWYDCPHEDCRDRCITEPPLSDNRCFQCHFSDQPCKEMHRKHYVEFHFRQGAPETTRTAIQKLKDMVDDVVESDTQHWKREIEGTALKLYW